MKNDKLTTDVGLLPALFPPTSLAETWHLGSGRVEPQNRDPEAVSVGTKQEESC